MTKPFINIQSDGGRIGRICWCNGRPTRSDRKPFRWGGVVWDQHWPATDPLFEAFEYVLGAMKVAFSEKLATAFAELGRSAAETTSATESLTVTVHSVTDGDAT